jgi:hypothetical protein
MASKEKNPTLSQILRQHKKLEAARDAARTQEAQLRDCLLKIRGREGIVVDDDMVYRVSVSYGQHPEVKVDWIGSKGLLEEILK